MLPYVTILLIIIGGMVGAVIRAKSYLQSKVFVYIIINFIQIWAEFEKKHKNQGHIFTCSYSVKGSILSKSCH